MLGLRRGFRSRATSSSGVVAGRFRRTLGSRFSLSFWFRRRISFTLSPVGCCVLSSSLSRLALGLRSGGAVRIRCLGCILLSIKSLPLSSSFRWCGFRDGRSRRSGTFGGWNGVVWRQRLRNVGRCRQVLSCGWRSGRGNCSCARFAGLTARRLGLGFLSPGRGNGWNGIWLLLLGWSSDWLMLGLKGWCRRD